MHWFLAVHDALFFIFCKFFASFSFSHHCGVHLVQRCLEELNRKVLTCAFFLVWIWAFINPWWPSVWRFHSVSPTSYLDISIFPSPTYFSQFQKLKWLLSTSWWPPGSCVLVEFPNLLNMSLIKETQTHTQAEQHSMTEQHDPHKLVSVDTNKS